MEFPIQFVDLIDATAMKILPTGSIYLGNICRLN